MTKLSACDYGDTCQDFTVSSITDNDETDRVLNRFVRHAGFVRPTPLQSTIVPLALQGRDLLVEAEHGDGKTGAMIIPLLTLLRDRHEHTIKALILTGSKKKIASILHQFKRFAPRSGRRPSIAAVGHEENVPKELHTSKKQTDILVGTPDRIIDHIRRNNVQLSNVEYAILDVPDDVDEQGFDKDVRFVYSKLRGKRQTIAYLRDAHASPSIESILKRPQAIYRSHWNTITEHESGSGEEKMDDTERIKDAMAALVKRVKEGENPEILNHYRKIFRRSVPLHLRGYVSALFIKEYLGDEKVDAYKPAGSKPAKTRLSGKKDAPSETQSEDNPDGTKTLFVSIGKNRKVYPKDLIKLFSETGGLEQSEIGSIKILDSYSFVDVPVDRAEKAIAALDGADFRGRKISVNNARKKKRK